MPIVKKLSRILNMFTFIKKSNIIVIPKVVSRIQPAHIYFFKSLQSGLPMYHIKPPISLITYPNVENPKNQADQFGVFFTKKRVESDALKINFLHSNFNILAIGTSHGPYKHPHVKNKLSK